MTNEMKRSCLGIAAAAVLLCLLRPVSAVSPSSEELSLAQSWLATRFGEHPMAKDGGYDELPFSFSYGGQRSSELLGRWAFAHSQHKLDANRTRHVLRWRDPQTGLVVRCVAIGYRDFPIVEWTVYLKNEGPADTPLITQLRALDMSVPCASSDTPDESDEAAQTRRWDAARDWGAAAADHGRSWRYLQGWVAQWKPLEQFDNDPQSGLERWRSTAGGEAWIGKNVSDKAVMVDGVPVAPGKLVMHAGAGTVGAGSQPGSCPAIAWRCTESGLYRLRGRLKNIGRGGDGIEWLLHDWNWQTLRSGRIADRQEGTFEIAQRRFGTGEQVALTFHCRGNTTGDLTEVEFEVVKLSDPRPGDAILRYVRGSEALVTDYEPVVEGVRSGRQVRFAPKGGRPCDGLCLPFFNIELPPHQTNNEADAATNNAADAGASGGPARGPNLQDAASSADVSDVDRPRAVATPADGLIIAIGWPGQWMAQFDRRQPDTLRIVAGQETTRFKLRSGEQVRTPLVAVQFYRGDWLRAQNLWRRWIVRHNLPRPNAKPIGPQFAACSSHQFHEMIDANEANQKLFVDRYLEEGIKLDYWWMDAGWYVNNGEWTNTGSWIVDRRRFPNGLRAVSDHARKRGVKTIVWFEPERVTTGTEIFSRYSQWLLAQKHSPDVSAYQSAWRLFNLGNADARRWLTDRIDDLIRSEGIDLYRQDFNVRPLYFWIAADEADRQGITENHYVSGYLAFWDELLRRHPGMLIDSCASGGRRNDLETMRRSVPLLRSDYLFDPLGQQCHTYGMAFWYPFFGTAADRPDKVDAYVYRSNLCPHNTACYDVRDRSLDYDLLRRLHKQWRQIAPYFLHDYYPLTPYSLSSRVWMAWQFHDCDRQAGIVQAFRRRDCEEQAIVLKLHGLSADARYRMIDLDTSNSYEATGNQLMTVGVRVQATTAPGAIVMRYEKQP